MKIAIFLLVLFVCSQAYNVDNIDTEELIRAIQNEMEDENNVPAALKDNIDLDEPEENETEDTDPKLFRFRRALRRIGIRVRGRRIWRRVGKPAICAFNPRLCPFVRG